MSQHASFPSKLKYTKVSYKYDVSFIGTRSPYRDWFIYELKKKELIVFVLVKVGVKVLLAIKRCKAF